MTAIRVTLLCGVLLLSGGCFLSKKPAVVVPVTAPPTPAAQAPSPTATKPAASAPAKPVPTQNVPAPAQPATDAAKPSPFPPTPKPVTSAPVKPVPVPAPALGAILTADQRKQLDAAYQSDLRQANLVLSKLNGRSLTAEQADSVSRARAWIRQAAQYHDRDLATAAELARRAKVLTQDLAGALK